MKIPRYHSYRIAMNIDRKLNKDWQNARLDDVYKAQVSIEEGVVFIQLGD